MYNVERYELAKQVKDRYVDRLFSIEGLVSVVSVGVRVDDNGEPYIHVGTSDPILFPNELDGIPVVVQCIGKIVPHGV
jgi:hypothetical protein